MCHVGHIMNYLQPAAVVHRCLQVGDLEVGFHSTVDQFKRVHITSPVQPVLRNVYPRALFVLGIEIRARVQLQETRAKNAYSQQYVTNYLPDTFHQDKHKRPNAAYAPLISESTSLNRMQILEILIFDIQETARIEITYIFIVNETQEALCHKKPIEEKGLTAQLVKKRFCIDTICRLHCRESVLGIFQMIDERNILYFSIMQFLQMC